MPAKLPIRVATRLALLALPMLALAGCESGPVLNSLPAPTFGDPDPRPVVAVAPSPRVNLPVTRTTVHQPRTERIPQVTERYIRPRVTGDPAWARHKQPARKWKWIIIHHSDTRNGNAETFDRHHRQHNHWDELGYHFVIGNGHGSSDGQVEVGSRWLKQKHGAHCKTDDNRFNDWGIGVCLVGEFDRTRPSRAQMASLKRLVRWLMATYHIPAASIRGHGEAVNGEPNRGTNCPGRYFDMNAFRRQMAR
jgi:hypothetical protein